jgi:hypothetical protein
LIDSETLEFGSNGLDVPIAGAGLKRKISRIAACATIAAALCRPPGSQGTAWTGGKPEPAQRRGEAAFQASEGGNVAIRAGAKVRIGHDFLDRA